MCIYGFHTKGMTPVTTVHGTHTWLPQSHPCVNSNFTVLLIYLINGISWNIILNGLGFQTTWVF